jgi:hypothetical protein
MVHGNGVERDAVDGEAVDLAGRAGHLVNAAGDAGKAVQRAQQIDDVFVGDEMGLGLLLQVGEHQCRLDMIAVAMGDEHKIDARERLVALRHRRNRIRRRRHEAARFKQCVDQDLLAAAFDKEPLVADIGDVKRVGTGRCRPQRHQNGEHLQDGSHAVPLSGLARQI